MLAILLCYKDQALSLLEKRTTNSIFGIGWEIDLRLCQPGRRKRPASPQLCRPCSRHVFITLFWVLTKEQPSFPVEHGLARRLVEHTQLVQCSAQLLMTSAKQEWVFR